MYMCAWVAKLGTYFNLGCTKGYMNVHIKRLKVILTPQFLLCRKCSDETKASTV